jgi:hypothetical protein
VQQPAQVPPPAAAADPFAGAPAQQAQQQEPSATAGGAADPFASLGSHDLLSNIQTMAVSTNAPAAAAGPVASAGSTTGLQQQQQQHSRSNSGSGAATPKKTAEDILKLYDAPMQQQPLAAPIAAVGAVSQLQYGFMAAAPAGMPRASMQQPPRPPAQHQQQLILGSVGSGFTHHATSVMTPVVPAGSSAAGLSNGLVSSGAGSLGATGSALI